MAKANRHCLSSPLSQCTLLLATFLSISCLHPLEYFYKVRNLMLCMSFETIWKQQRSSQKIKITSIWFRYLPVAHCLLFNCLNLVGIKTYYHANLIAFQLFTVWVKYGSHFTLPSLLFFWLFGLPYLNRGLRLLSVRLRYNLKSSTLLRER